MFALESGHSTVCIRRPILLRLLAAEGFIYGKTFTDRTSDSQWKVSKLTVAMGRAPEITLSTLGRKQFAPHKSLKCISGPDGLCFTVHHNLAISARLCFKPH
jgi:hypothetical protein